MRTNLMYLRVARDPRALHSRKQTPSPSGSHKATEAVVLARSSLYSHAAPFSRQSAILSTVARKGAAESRA